MVSGIKRIQTALRFLALDLVLIGMDLSRLMQLADQFGGPVVFVMDGKEYVIHRVESGECLVDSLAGEMSHQPSTISHQQEEKKQESLAKDQQVAFSDERIQSDVSRFAFHDSRTSLLDKIAFTSYDYFTTQERERMEQVVTMKETYQTTEPGEPIIESLSEMAEIREKLDKDILLEDRFTIVSLDE